MEQNYLDTFIFPDIPWQSYPVYSVSEKGRVYNLKNLIYPNSTSTKRFTRNKQLRKRSQQAKIFDTLINIGYWEPLLVAREFPIIIQNHLRINGIDGGFFLLDYYFPTLRLAIELDSELHDPQKDELRDQYLQKIGIRVKRITHLEKPEIQRTKFRELCKEMRLMTPIDNPMPFSFSDNIRLLKSL